MAAIESRGQFSDLFFESPLVLDFHLRLEIHGDVRNRRSQGLPGNGLSANEIEVREDGKAEASLPDRQI